MPGTENILIEFTSDVAGLEPAIDQLERLKVIDKATADAFKNTTAELNKRATAVQNTAKAITNTSADTKKSIDSVNNSVRNLSANFTDSFRQGAKEALDEAGVTIEEFTQALQSADEQTLKNALSTKEVAEQLEILKGAFKGASDNSSFANFGAQISAAEEKMKETSHTLNEMKQSGLEGNEEFEKLQRTLKEQGVELERLKEEYEVVTEKSEEFSASTGNLDVKSNTLLSRLKELKAQLALLKEAGKEDSAEFRKLAAEAANLQDSIDDVNKTIHVMASDTNVFDGLISAVSGVAGGFAITQGAIALFGDRSEELQEVLVRVNAAMAILQGLQQVQNVLQKESAASRLVDVIATKAQVVIQRIYTAVTGQATAATTAFKVALASTGIGLLVIGIIALIQALHDEDASLEEVNAELERNKRANEKAKKAIEDFTLIEELRNKKSGELESKLTGIRAKGIQSQISLLEKSNIMLAKQRDELEEHSKAWEAINDRIGQQNEDIDGLRSNLLRLAADQQKAIIEEQRRNSIAGIQNRLNLAKIGSRLELDLNKQLVRAKAQEEIEQGGKTSQEILEIRSDALKQLRELDLAFARRQQEDRIAVTNTALDKEVSAREKTSNEVGRAEIDLQKKLISQKAQLDILQSGLSEKKKTEIRVRAINEQLRIERQFQEQTIKDAFAAQVSKNNAELTQLNISVEERQRLLEENIIIQAQLEVDAAKDNSAKILEINKERDRQIREVRLQTLNEQLARETQLETARAGAFRRNQERIAGSERATLQERISAINRVATIDIQNINLRQDANEDSLRRGLISQQEYEVQFAKLKDEELAVTEQTELRKRELVRQTNEQAISFALDAGQQILDIISQFGQQNTEREEQNISEQKKRVDELRQAGAITEKEAILRQKRLDNQEAAIKQKAAQRDKQIAIFSAIINTAQSITKTIAQLGFPLAIPFIALAAITGAAQVALIANRPIPKFKGGKKDRYEGWGITGDAGAELVEKDGKMYVRKKPTVEWLAASDKVYTAKETKEMLHPEMVNVRIDTKQGERNEAPLDYKKLGKVIADNIPKTGLNWDEDGIAEWVQSKNGFTKYIGKRRGY